MWYGVHANESAPDSLESRTLVRTALPRSLLKHRLPQCSLQKNGSNGLAECATRGDYGWATDLATLRGAGFQRGGKPARDGMASRMVPLRFAPPIAGSRADAIL